MSPNVRDPVLNPILSGVFSSGQLVTVSAVIVLHATASLFASQSLDLYRHPPQERRKR
nr:uncharacterized protein CTRU02_06325 [Colletotrichum truncatum]KAF6792829.1 hypothetical protein CTRU02_06325 [Colletotrichum truncatum]